MPTAAKPAKAKRKATAPRKVKRTITTNIEFPLKSLRNQFNENKSGNLVVTKYAGTVNFQLKDGGRMHGFVTTVEALEELVQLLKADVRVVESKP